MGRRAGAREPRGDANAGDRGDLSDAVVVLGFLFLGAAAPSCMDGADADDSGTVNITDAVYVLAYLFLGDPAPPMPGPTTCGEDTTPDELGCATATRGCVPEATQRTTSLVRRDDKDRKVETWTASGKAPVGREGRHCRRGERSSAQHGRCSGGSSASGPLELVPRPSAEPRPEPLFDLHRRFKSPEPIVALDFPRSGDGWFVRGTCADGAVNAR